MGKVKLKSMKGDKVKNRLDSQPMEDASAQQLGHMLAFASSSAVRAVPRKKKEKRKMRHEALVKKIEAGKIVKKKHHKKKAHVPKALDMRNLMDALPTMVERKAAKAGRLQRKSRASKSFQAKKKLMEKDMKHLQQVVNQAQFQANPIDAVLNHLRQAYKS